MGVGVVHTRDGPGIEYGSCQWRKRAAAVATLAQASTHQFPPSCLTINL